MAISDLDRIFFEKNKPYVPPFFSIDYKNSQAVVEWFLATDKDLNEYYHALFREQRDNLNYFVGNGLNPTFVSPYVATFTATSAYYNNPDAIYINQMYTRVIDQVSLVVSHELVPDVLPNSDDYADKVACNVTKDWLDSIHYDLDLDLQRQRWEMQKKIFGEAFVIVLWNSAKGNLKPESRRDKILDDEDFDILNQPDSMEMAKKNIRAGDLDYKNPMPWMVHIDPQDNFSLSNWFYWKDAVDLEVLRREYPHFDFEKAPDAQVWDPNGGKWRDCPNKRIVYSFYHRAHKFLPKGRYVVATSEGTLINQDIDMPTMLNNQSLPLIRFTDLDIGIGTRGVPILFRNCKNVNEAYNKTTNQIYNNLEMESPKVFVHETAGVDAERMPNGIIVCEWRGNYEPKIITPQTNTSAIFQFREQLKKDMDELSLQTPMVRGDTPNAQLDSFVALQYFEDMRTQLASPDIKGHIKALENLFRLEIVIAADHYRPDDKRLIKILGRNNTYQLRYFDPVNLGKSYDVKISTSGNLANGKAARTQMIMTLKEKFGHMISDEVFLDTLGLTHYKKFQNAITSAVSSAEAENMDMMNGQPVLAPERFEDLIAHWDSHRIPMQTLDFKQSDPEIQDLFIRHVTATEKLMYELAAESPVFADRLNTLQQFPLFYAPAPINPDIGGLPTNPGLDEMSAMDGQKEEMSVEQAEPQGQSVPSGQPQPIALS